MCAARPVPPLPGVAEVKVLPAAGVMVLPSASLYVLMRPLRDSSGRMTLSLSSKLSMSAFVIEQALHAPLEQPDPAPQM
jgi:hypothetical protein